MTKHTAADIPVAVESLLDTPRNGQIPKNCANTILFTNIADIMISKISIIQSLYYFLRNLLNNTMR